jgi:hypothetical protein
MRSFLLIVGASIIVAAPLLTIGMILRREYFREAPRRFWTGIGVPLTMPIIVAVLGVVFGVVSNATQQHEYENQKKLELLREVLASKDRPDVAFLTAVSDKLVMVLNRRQEIILRQHGTSISQDERQRLQAAQHFEEQAAYFFFGMYHSALIDFYASKGYKLYPRLWMERAFDGLAARVDTLVFGADGSSPDVSGPEESALYEYFGEAAATYKTITERPGESRKTAVLLDFSLMLDRTEETGSPPDPYRDHLERTLQEGWATFKGRLDPGPRALDVRELELTVAAISALDDYAFNKLFAVWYQGRGSPAEVESLSDEFPGTISPDPPKEFLFYPLRGWGDQDIRYETWKIIFDQVPAKFKS